MKTTLIPMDVNSAPTTWSAFNIKAATADAELKGLVASFPPPELMQRVSGLTDHASFAKSGSDIFLALVKASPKPLSAYISILDFGVGSGRLARMFKGFKGRYTGADVDHELVEWVGAALPWVRSMPTTAREPLPTKRADFDCVISISVFTHMNEADSKFYLQSLMEASAPGAFLFLTVHGDRALKRAETETRIFEMLSIPAEGVSEARSAMNAGGFKFILQNGHLTTETYEYGISFTSEAYIHAEWGKYFDIVSIEKASIHDFQDIVVLRRRKDSLLSRLMSYFG